MHLRNHLWLLEGRPRQATAGIVDSQSVKGSETCGQHSCGAGKKIKGTERHILEDTLGLLQMVSIAANVQDRDGTRQLLAQVFQVPGRTRWLWADGDRSPQRHRARLHLAAAPLGGRAHLCLAMCRLMLHRWIKK